MTRALGLSHLSRGSRRALGLALATIALLLGAPVVALAVWPQFQGAGTHAGVSDGPTAPLVVAWANLDIEVGGADPRGGLSAPVVAEDGTIVTVTPAAVLGFSSSDGSPVFTTERDFGPSSQPAVAEGSRGPVVVFTEGYGDQPPAAAVSASPSASPSPAGAGDGDSFDSHVNAVDLHGDPAWDAPVQLDALVLMPVAVDDRAAYVADVAGGLTALALGSGEELWTADLGTQVAGAVSVEGDRLYATSLGSQTDPGAVVALDAATGEEVWRTTEESISGNPVSTAVVTGSGIVLLEAGSVVSLDPEDGGLNWRTEIVNPLRSPPFFFQGTATPAPVSADGSVYVVDVTGRAYSLDAETGAVRWDYALNDPSPASPPVLTSDHLLIPTDSGTLDAIDRETGHLAWRLDASDRGFLRGLADAGDMLVAVAGSDDASLIAFESDPDPAALLDEPSPTTLDLGRLMLGFALGGLVFGAIAVAILRPVQRRLGPAIDADRDDTSEGVG
jgi:outer membrane protein assembly factor BamB